MEQTYPGKEDHERHFYGVFQALKDPRYLKIDNKPVFFIYRPRQLPESKEFVGLWNNLAVKNGLNGIYFLGMDGDLIKVVTLDEIDRDELVSWVEKEIEVVA